MSADTNPENAKVIEFLNKIEELQTDLLRTLGINSVGDFLAEQLKINIRDTNAVYKLYSDFSSIIKSSTTGSNDFIPKIFEVFQKNGFTQTQYRSLINVLSRLYIAVSRKKFVLSHQFDYYYNKSLDQPGGKKKKTGGGGLPSAFDIIDDEEKIEFNCGNQETIIQKIVDKTQSINTHFAKMTSIMKLYTRQKIN